MIKIDNIIVTYLSVYSGHSVEILKKWLNIGVIAGICLTETLLNKKVSKIDLYVNNENIFHIKDLIKYSDNVDSVTTFMKNKNIYKICVNFLENSSLLIHLYDYKSWEDIVDIIDLDYICHGIIDNEYKDTHVFTCAYNLNKIHYFRNLNELSALIAYDLGFDVPNYTHNEYELYEINSTYPGNLNKYDMVCEQIIKKKWQSISNIKITKIIINIPIGKNNSNKPINIDFYHEKNMLNNPKIKNFPFNQKFMELLVSYDNERTFEIVQNILKISDSNTRSLDCSYANVLFNYVY